MSFDEEQAKEKIVVSEDLVAEAVGRTLWEKMRNVGRTVVESEQLKDYVKVAGRELALVGIITAKFFPGNKLAEIVKSGAAIIGEKIVNEKLELHPNIPDAIVDVCNMAGVGFTPVSILMDAAQFEIDTLWNTPTKGFRLAKVGIEAIREQFFSKPVERQQQVVEAVKVFTDN
ncbi:MAG: hypothetical protein WAV41_02620 [Microgenomates group bacterium]